MSTTPEKTLDLKALNFETISQSSYCKILVTRIQNFEAIWQTNLRAYGKGHEKFQDFVDLILADPSSIRT